MPGGLPDTPQGRHVSTYIEAFNAGEKAFVAMYGVVTIPQMAVATPPERRAELYKQLVREVETIKVEKVIESSPKSITFSMRVPRNGTTATFMFNFTFEDKAPFRIAAIDMEVSQR
jgi:hypothetical protein